MSWKNWNIKQELHFLWQTNIYINFNINTFKYIDVYEYAVSKAKCCYNLYTNNIKNITVVCYIFGFFFHILSFWGILLNKQIV